MELRIASQEQFSAIAEAERSAFAQPLTEKDLQDLSQNELFRILIWCADGEVCGHCVLYRVLDEAEITSFVIRHDLRGKGCGTAFLQALFPYLRNDGAKIAYLEVRQSNVAAQRLYKKCGFTPIGVRKRFYERPVEDAVAMGIEL